MLPGVISSIDHGFQTSFLPLPQSLQDMMLLEVWLREEGIFKCFFAVRAKGAKEGIQNISVGHMKLEMRPCTVCLLHVTCLCISIIIFTHDYHVFGEH